MNCTWEGCNQPSSHSLVLKHKGPVLAKLCHLHWNELMEAPKRGALSDGIETFGVKMQKAIYAMPVQL